MFRGFISWLHGKKIGKYYTLKEMDSIRIYNRTNWYRWSRQSEKGSNGGSQIDFLRVFAGMDVKEAVFWLLDFAGYKKADDSERHNSLKHCVDKSIIDTEEKNLFFLKHQTVLIIFIRICKMKE